MTGYPVVLKAVPGSNRVVGNGDTFRDAYGVQSFVELPVKPDKQDLRVDTTGSKALQLLPE